MELNTEEIIQLNRFLQIAKFETKEENVSKALNSLMLPKNGYLGVLSHFESQMTVDLAKSFINLTRENLPKRFDCRKLLMEAIQTGSQVVVELMLSKGIDVNYKIDEEKNSGLLDFAVVEKQLEIVKLLLKQGADVDALCECKCGCSNQLTALTFAALNGDIKILKVLLDSGANIHVKDDIGRSLLHHVILGSASGLTKDEATCQQVFELLLEKGVDINGKGGESGYTPLHLAIDKKCNNLVKLLLNKGANIEEVEGYFQLTPLFFAVIMEDKEILKLLLDRGANIAARTTTGHTVLYSAFGSKNEEIIKILLDYGADFNIVPEQGLSYFHIADTKNIIEMLLTYGADINSRIENDTGFNGSSALGLAAHLGNAEQAKTLIDNGAEVNIQDQLGNTPLIRAVCQGNSSIVQMLLNAGASVTSEVGDDCYDSLYFAALQGHKEILEMLLKHGSDVNCKCTGGSCPAILAAAREGHQEIVKILLSHGADITEGLIRDVAGLGLNDMAKVFVKELVRRKFVSSQAISNDILACIREFEFLETFLTDCQTEILKTLIGVFKTSKRP